MFGQLRNAIGDGSMKIAFSVIKGIDYGGGIEKYTLELGSRLVKRGHDVTVYTMRNYGPAPIEYAGMHIIEVPCMQLRQAEKLSASVTSVMRTVSDGQFDIVHFMDTVPAALALLTRLFSKSRCVVQFLSFGWKLRQWGPLGVLMLKLLEKASIRQAHVYSAVSRNQCRYFRERYGLPVTYIPSGTNVKPTVPAKEILELGIEPNGYVFLASRLVAEKGPQYLIPAFRKLDTDCKLVIAGDAPDGGFAGELKALAGGDERIIFLGHVHGRLLEELFSNASVYVQPSETEGLSIALLEAMSHGNACLVSDIPANLEAIADTGWSFRNKSVESLTAKLGWMLRHPDKLVYGRQQARNRAQEHYDWDLITTQFEHIYSKILQSRKAA